MKISIFGTGYVGLVTGVCLAELGHQVLCVDIDEEKIAGLKKGVSPIYESGLPSLLIKNIKNNRIDFTTDMRKGVEYSSVIFNAVGTPTDPSNGSADLRYVESVASTFGKYISRYSVLVNKSTVPVGTATNLQKIINNELYKRKLNIEYDVASNPEFLREGNAIGDFMNPDRIVIGTSSDRANKLLKEVYAPLTQNGVTLIETDPASSEIIKYASNAFLATKISFINEIANFSEKVGGDIGDIARAMGHDKRIGKHFLGAGLGYGGSCFPKDVKALIQTGKESDYDFQIIAAVEQVNEKQKLKAVSYIKSKFEKYSDLNITLWGLAFKPNTDDTRESVSEQVIKGLIDLGVNKIQVHDPIVDSIYTQQFGEIVELYDDKYNSLENSDALILITDWDEYKVIDWNLVKKTMNHLNIFDGRNIWNKSKLSENGFNYTSIGR